MNEAKIKGITAEMSADGYERVRLEDITKWMRQESEKKQIADIEMRTYLDKVKDVNVKVLQSQSANRIAREKEEELAASVQQPESNCDDVLTALSVGTDVTKDHSIAAEREQFLEFSSTVEELKIITPTTAAAAAAVCLRGPLITPVNTPLNVPHAAPSSALKPLVCSDVGYMLATGATVLSSAFRDDNDGIFIKDSASIVVEGIHFVKRTSTSLPTSLPNSLPVAFNSNADTVDDHKTGFSQFDVPDIQVTSVELIVYPSSIALPQVPSSTLTPASPTTHTSLIPAIASGVVAKAANVRTPSMSSFARRATISAPSVPTPTTPPLIRRVSIVKRTTISETKNLSVHASHVHTSVATLSTPTSPTAMHLLNPSSRPFIPGTPLLAGQVAKRIINT